jgi:hypothetical protein
MGSILDRFTAAAPQVPIHPAGRAAHPAPVPPRVTGPLPPPAPCGNVPAPLDLFADPAEQPRPCGCPLFWIDGFGNLHCHACRPPLRCAMARQRLSVVTTSAGYAWEDWETRERLTGDDVKPDAAPDPDAHPVLVKLLDDDEMYWAIVQRRDRNNHIPIDMTLDAWWKLNESRQAEAMKAREIAEEYRKTGFSPSRPPENSSPKKAARKTLAAKKNTSPEIFLHEEFFD